MFCPEEGADPGSIEKVALHVLSIKLPVPRTTLEKMLTQIKDSLSNLTNIEGIMNHSLQHINKAKELLVQAKDAKYGIKVTLKLLVWLRFPWSVWSSNFKQILIIGLPIYNKRSPTAVEICVAGYFNSEIYSVWRHKKCFLTTVSLKTSL